MRNEGLGSWPARRARKTPHRTALIHDGTTITYAALHERTTRLAHALRARGVRRGDRVAYLGANHPAHLEVLRQETDVHLYVEVGAAYDELLSTGTSTTGPLDERVTGDDTCVIMYTSGTTGRPKGAMLTHANLTWNALNVLIDIDLAADERALVSAPLFHTAGLNMLTLPVLLKGGTCVLVPSFDPGQTLDLIARHGITFMFGVPTMYDLVARDPAFPTADLSSLRTLTCGGAPVPTSLITTYQERGLTFQQGYGMTEASPGVLFLDAAHALDKAGSAGVPHFFSDVRVVRPDLAPAAPGETGEVLVKGPHVMSGYWGLPDATATAFTDGWFHTGDAARTDDDGYVHIVDRIKDMIISGGENIYPAEVEDALLAHPDIAECAVIGVPDTTWGEVGRAIVVPHEGRTPDPAEILDSLGARLARYKIPKSVVLAPALPRTASGKLRKSALRAHYGTPTHSKEPGA